MRRGLRLCNVWLRIVATLHKFLLTKTLLSCIIGVSKGKEIPEGKGRNATMLGFYGNFYGRDCFLTTPIKEKSLALGLDLLEGIRKKLRMRKVVITNYEAHAVTEAMEPASLENIGEGYARIAALDGSWEVEGALMDEIIIVNGM